MEKHLPILAFIAYALAVFPQSDFRPGYIIRYDHDTITGEIDYRANRLMATQCTFRLPDGTVNRYTPSDIAAYRFADGKYYETKVWNGRRTFFEVLVKGELCVYFMKDEQGEHYFLEKQELPLVEIPYQTHTRVKDGSTFVRSNEHYGVLNYYTQDAPALRSEIKKMEELTPKRLITLAEDYHNMVCDDHACIVYQNTPPKVKVALELTGGTFYTFRNTATGTDGGWLAWHLPGVYAHISLPRVNERLFLRTGFVTQFCFDKPNMHAPWWERGKKELEARFKIPLQLEYQYTKGVVQPKVAYGITYYLPAALKTSAMAGVNFRITEHLALALDYEVEFYPFKYLPVLPSRYPWGHSLQLGLCYLL